ncbi:hypothetical protein ACO22_07086 [Paracoccidioides brasiliensis]|uniref:Uncharacterized protein n=1 Tax=Paracoccidioides brasiliensis TaxID=121759 RepID=A0A1D2J5P5_PARBR|nr:hypothetical protein ACO22_07086 [Paracoccidioides brasiliensis]
MATPAPSAVAGEPISRVERRKRREVAPSGPQGKVLVLGVGKLLIALIANWRGEEGGQTRTGDASPDWEGASGATAG